MGSVEHPMTDEHSIEWVAAVGDQSLIVHHFQPGEAPSVKVCDRGAKEVYAIVICMVCGKRSFNMDQTVLYQLSYGLYAIGVMDGQNPTGCIVNTVFQITSDAPSIAVSINKNNYTMEVLKQNPQFGVSILSEDVPPEVIGNLGFSSGKEK